MQPAIGKRLYTPGIAIWFITAILIKEQHPGVCLAVMTGPLYCRHSASILMKYAVWEQRAIMKIALLNARLITNTDKAITSLRWRTVIVPRSLKQSTTTAHTLVCLLAVICLLHENLWAYVTSWAVYRDDCTAVWILCTTWFSPEYVVSQGTGQRICVNHEWSSNWVPTTPCRTIG